MLAKKHEDSYVYYQLDSNLDNKRLIKPIIIDNKNPEIYLEILLNNETLLQGKPKHILKDRCFYSNSSYTIITHLDDREHFSLKKTLQPSSKQSLNVQPKKETSTQISDWRKSKIKQLLLALATAN